MINLFPILSTVIFLPLIGALFIFLFVRGEGEEALANCRNAALWTSIVTFLLSLILWINFDPQIAGFQFVERINWLADYNINYIVGIDGISLFLILLTTFLMPLCILAGWNVISHRPREYMIAFLLLETLTIGVFAALDLVVFYFFFEAVLIPMFLIIGIWGGENRIYAAFKFFLYTLAGSVLFLLAILYIYFHSGTTDITVLMNSSVQSYAPHIQKFLWLAFFASFAVKIPMWPVHTWLPDAHVQAPTAGSMILAGILIKMGAYAFLRLSIPLLPEASLYYAPLIYSLSIVAVIYTSLVALMQEDMKKLIAYSSVAHMGYVTAGIFSFTEQGLSGAVFQMLSHGVVSAALFLCVGVLYDRLHTKKIADFGGLVERMPRYALFFMLFTMASVGLPGTSGFVGEFLVLLGVFADNTYASALLATGVIIGAAYMLWLYRRVVFGEVVHKKLLIVQDLNGKEKLIFISFSALVLVMGIYPSFILSVISPSVKLILAHLQQAMMVR